MHQKKLGEFLATLVRQGAIAAPEIPDEAAQFVMEGSGQKVLAAMLAREIPKLRMDINGAPSDFPIWKILQLGTGLTTATDFRTALKKAGCRIGNWANDILGQPTFTASVSVVEQVIRLVVASVAELGFNRGASYEKICARARELGLQLCPPEVGPQLRLQYTDQPLSEWLVIAMEPISDSSGLLSVFYVERDDVGLWLRSCRGDPGDFWLGHYRFVFVSRK